MRQKQLKIIAVLLLTFGLTGLQAQEVIPATGGNALGSGGSVSFSVGQFVYSTHNGSNGSVALGVQQPYEISVVTGLEETTINLIVTAYPNPTTFFLKLKIEALSTLNISSLRYQLYNIQGKLLQSSEIERKETRIDMSNLVPATYFVKVTHENKKIKTFKIIKN